MAGKEEKEKRLVGPFLEVLHLWSSNAGIRAQTDAKRGGGDANWWQRNLSYQNYRNCRQDFGAKIGEQQTHLMAINVEMRSVFPVETQRTKSAAEEMTHMS